MVLTATVALSTMLAGSASAEGWFVDGTKLVAGSKVALATSAKVDESAFLSVPSEKIRVTCAGSTLNGVKPEIIGTTKGTTEHLIFTGCSTTEPSPGCELKGQPTAIETVGVEAKIRPWVSKSPNDLITFAPQHGSKTLAIIVFDGTGNKVVCQEEAPIRGEVTVNAPNGQNEETLQAIEGLGTVENNSLEIGSTGFKAYIEGGQALLKLQSGGTWSFGIQALLKTTLGPEEFGPVALGTPVKKKIKFVTMVAVKIGTTTIDPITGGTFTVTQNTCSGTHPANEPCEIEVEFNPTAANVSNADLLINVEETEAPKATEVKTVRLRGSST